MSYYRVNPIKEGDGVEVINCGLGNGYAYYGAMVISAIADGKCTICYTHLTAENDENKPLVEDVPVAMLRPVPEVIPQWEYCIGEIVDGWYNNGWWLGRVVARVDGTLTQYVVRLKIDHNMVLFFRMCAFIKSGVAEFGCMPNLMQTIKLRVDVRRGLHCAIVP